MCGHGQYAVNTSSDGSVGFHSYPAVRNQISVHNYTGGHEQYAGTLNTSGDGGVGSHTKNSACSSLGWKLSSSADVPRTRDSSWCLCKERREHERGRNPTKYTRSDSSVAAATTTMTTMTTAVASTITTAATTTTNIELTTQRTNERNETKCAHNEQNAASQTTQNKLQTQQANTAITHTNQSTNGYSARAATWTSVHQSRTPLRSTPECCRRSSTTP